MLDWGQKLDNEGDRIINRKGIIQTLVVGDDRSRPVWRIGRG